jgi:diguanylate cyclase (GGDEF)-like protein
MQDASVSDVRPEELQVLRSRVLELETLIQERRITDESDSVGASMLASRVVLVDRISQASHRSRRAGTKVAVMAVDIDIVRTLMTTRGNSPAEKLTRLVASRLKKTLRSTDTISLQGADEIEFSVSRTGAGEFVVLLTDIQDSECTTWIAKRLFDALEDPVDIEGDEILLDASIGLSLYPTDGEDPDLLLSNAAAAMREARVAQGRHVCLFYCKEMNQRSKRQLEMETQLHHAIERSEMFLEYQPGIDLQTGRIANFEALLRWRHPKWGMVRPDEFIPVAEHAGLIEDIGVWVFRSAMRQLKAWNDAGFDHLSVAINFSAIQFRDESLVDTLVETIHDVGVAAESVVIEITESALIQSLETAVKIVDGLSAAGVRIALDDFGTGYSSLSYLKRFAIDVVKIDRSFLADFPSQAHDTEIVSAIIAMSHSLGLRVVAEGVEEDRQLQVLQNLNCDEIQGYVFSKPVPRDRATALLTSPTDFRRRVRAAGENSIRGLSLKESPMSGVLNEAPRRGAAG